MIPMDHLCPPHQHTAHPKCPGQTSAQVSTVWDPWWSATPNQLQGPGRRKHRRLDGDGKSSFWTSMRLQTPRATDIKLLINLAEWGTEIRFTEERVMWHLWLNLWKTAFSWQSKEEWKHLESTGSLSSHGLFPSFLPLSPTLSLFSLYLLITHTCT